jgi:iron complex transport system substrate-binding protein
MRSRIIFLILIITAAPLAAQSVRIITAGSGVTETVCALGDCDKIVASDRTSLYPASIQQLPSIGYRTGINAEGILSLKPTMVIAEKEYLDAPVLDQLKSSGVELVIVEQRYSFDETKIAINQIGRALGKTEEAKKLIAKNESELKEAEAMLSKTKSKPKVICVYNRGTSTMSIAGQKTFAEILRYVGASNAYPEVSGYKPLNTEALIAANPDYLVMISTGLESIGGVDGVLKIPGVAQTSAGKLKQIVAVESLKLTNFGPRFGEAVKELVLLLHPELQPK